MLDKKLSALKHSCSVLSRRTAFTLTELLVFLGVFAAVSGTLITVLITVTKVQVRQASSAEVNQQSQALLQQVQYYVEKSSFVDMPPDSSTSTLKLWTGINTQDPTYITLQNGIVYVQQTATGTLQPLTSSRVNITNLVFTKRSNPPSHDSVSVSFSIAYSTSNITQAISQMFQSSIARVSAATFDSNILPASSTPLNLGIAGQTWSSINQNMYFSGSNVGIGTTNNPMDTLELNGRLYLDAISAPASTTSRLYNVGGSLYWNGISLASQWTTTSTTSIYYNLGNVGVGTSTPATLFTVATTTNIFNVLSSGNVGIGTVSPSTTLSVNGTMTASAVAGAWTIPTVQKFTSGSGTYTTPAGVKYIRVRMVGGGGGGAAGFLVSGGAKGGNNGTNTTFGSSFLTANFGYGDGSGNGGPGGSATIGAGATGFIIPGGSGTAGVNPNGQSNGYFSGGAGGGSAFGGAGGGASCTFGVDAAVNSGSGGGGGGQNGVATHMTGGGGGAGGYLEAIITNPNSSYSYNVGTGGSGGTGGDYNGGAGGSGIIFVEEYYN